MCDGNIRIPFHVQTLFLETERMSGCVHIATSTVARVRPNLSSAAKVLKSLATDQSLKKWLFIYTLHTVVLLGSSDAVAVVIQ